MTRSDFGAYSVYGWRALLLHLAQSLPANWLGRRLALVCRKLVLVRGPDIIDATVDQLNYRLYMRDNVSERKFLFLPQFFDTFERQLLREQLTPESIFVDIGANAGIYTLAAVAQGSKVIAVEPNPVVLARLQCNLALNHLTERVTVVQKGVADVAGFFDLILDETNLGGASLLTGRSGPGLKIECDLLQSILHHEGIAHIDILKIDIEGAEDRALFPFFETVSPVLFPRFLIIERSESQWQRDLPSLLRDKGYQLIKQTRMNLIWQLS